VTGVVTAERVAVEAGSRVRLDTDHAGRRSQRGELGRGPVHDLNLNAAKQRLNLQTGHRDRRVTSEGDDGLLAGARCGGGARRCRRGDHHGTDDA
jgi:hypothetical protein